MAQRLVDLYRPGDLVEVLFTFDEEQRWHAAEVVAQQHPGVWVRTEHDGRAWFVTNGKRIRARGRADSLEAS